MTVPAIEFRDPPRHVRASHPGQDPTKNAGRAAVIDALRGHPDRWAVVSRHSSRPAASKVARLLRARHPDFTFQAAKDPTGGVVYGRFDSRDD